MYCSALPSQSNTSKTKYYRLLFYSINILRSHTSFIQIRSGPWCSILPLFRSGHVLSVPYSLNLDQIWCLVSHSPLYLNQIWCLVSHSSLYLNQIWRPVFNTPFYLDQIWSWCPILLLFRSDLVPGFPYSFYLDQIWCLVSHTSFILNRFHA